MLTATSCGSQAAGITYDQSGLNKFQAALVRIADLGAVKIPRPLPLPIARWPAQPIFPFSFRQLLTVSINLPLQNGQLASVYVGTSGGLTQPAE